MDNFKDLKKLIDEAPPLPWSGPTDSPENYHPEEYVFRDAEGEPVIFPVWYDGCLQGATIETERLVVLGLNSLPELIKENEALEKEVTILREELLLCQQEMVVEDL